MSHDIEIVRIVKAAPETCFAQCRDPEALVGWWGPKDDAGAPFRADLLAWDLADGAPWRIRMTAPSGAVYEHGGRVLEAKPPVLLRLSFAWFTDGEAGPESEILFRFEPHAKGTRLIFAHRGLTDLAARDSHMAGWETCLERFFEALPLTATA